MTALEALHWHDQLILERRPVAETMTDTERLDWFGENCDSFRYEARTGTTNAKFVIYDSMGQRTAENSLRDAIDSAAAKFKEANS